MYDEYHNDDISRRYTPPVEVTILEKRQAIPLDENEGIYVRNQTTGHVRLVVGKTCVSCVVVVVVVVVDDRGLRSSGSRSMKG